MSRPRKSLDEHLSSWWKEPDGSWRGKVAVGRRTDGSVAYARPRRSTEAAVKRAVRDIEKARDSRTRVWTAKDPTLSQWVSQWLDVILPLKQRRPKTITDYRSKLGKHVLPHLGTLRLSELQVAHLQSLYAQMAVRGSSQHVIHGTHRVVTACLNSAVRQQVLGINPSLNVEVAKPQEEEVEPFTKADARAILASARHLRNGPRWSVALSLGLRQGEALGLQWNDIDFDTGTLLVRRKLERVNGRHGCDSGPNDEGRWACGYKQGARCPTRLQGGLVLSALKSRDSRRAVQLPASLLTALREHRRLQAEERLPLGDLWDDRALVFPDHWGRPIDPRSDWSEWKRLLSFAGVPSKRLHDARHTAATLLLVLGVDSRTVMAILGWTEQRTAKRYTHVVDELRADAAARMDAALWALDA